ncbi:MAG TPA: DUF58 domain-containing protein [Longimicrobiales bacterium]|nr:DUF58 domain-containing protein [Longimicrobiales bacterium]
MIGWLRRTFQPSPARPPAPPVAQTAPVSREILKQVRMIELRTRGLVNSLFGGEYQSVFRGQGMEFSEVREYEPGDDVRNIDWNVTARTGSPYVKKHVEERELTVLLAVDLSGSEQFGTRGRFKAELAAELAAVLALSAIRNNDRVGMLLFSDRVEHVVPPRKGRRHALRLIRDVLAFRPRGRGTDIGAALDYAARLLPHRGIIFLLSDFAPAGNATAEDAARFEKTLRLVSRRHDLVAIAIADPGELALPDMGLVAIEDPETGELAYVDTGGAGVREVFGIALAKERLQTRRLFRRLGVDEIDVRTDAGYVRPLLAFFRRRERQRRR